MRSAAIRAASAGVSIVLLAAGALTVAGSVADGAPARGRGSLPTSASLPTHASLPTYEGVSIVLQLKGGPAYLCLGGILTSLPPAGCGGVVLPGVQARRLPGARVYANGTVDTPNVRVVGTWNGRTLTPTRPIVRAQPLPAPPSPSFRTACAHPGGSRPSDPAGLERLDEAVQTDPELSYLYVSGHGGRVVDVAFTGHLARHRAQLRRLYAGPLCVIRGHRSQRSLLLLERRIGADRTLLARHGVVVFSWGPSLDREQLQVAVADPAVRAFLRHRYGPALTVTGSLRRVR